MEGTQPEKASEEPLSDTDAATAQDTNRLPAVKIPEGPSTPSPKENLTPKSCNSAILTACQIPEATRPGSEAALSRFAGSSAGKSSELRPHSSQSSSEKDSHIALGSCFNPANTANKISHQRSALGQLNLASQKAAPSMPQPPAESQAAAAGSEPVCQGSMPVGAVHRSSQELQKPLYSAPKEIQCSRILKPSCKQPAGETGPSTLNLLSSKRLMVPQMTQHSKRSRLSPFKRRGCEAIRAESPSKGNTQVSKPRQADTSSIPFATTAAAVSKTGTTLI